MADTRPGLGTPACAGRASNPNHNLTGFSADADVRPFVLADVSDAASVCRQCGARLDALGVCSNLRAFGLTSHNAGVHFAPVRMNGVWPLADAEAPSREMIELSQIAEERLIACVSFCAGIPTEVLQRQLPLASNKRLSFEELQHLRRALPWLPAVEL